VRPGLGRRRVAILSTTRRSGASRSAAARLGAPLALVLLLPARARSQQDAEPAGSGLELAPDDVLYRPYVADPRRPVFGLTLIDVRDPDIEAGGDSRYGVRMGARFAILDLRPPEAPGGAIQLAGEIGFLGQFDRDNAADNLGWDGLYGLHVAWRAHPSLALRFGMAHDSSHLGDEYIEDTGAERIEYTREEVLLGLRWDLDPRFGAYLEYGHAYDLRNEDLMEPGRVQLGLEYEPEPSWWDGRLAPFAALDVSAFEEDDWEENLTVQLGVVLPDAGRGGSWRLGLEYYDGRSPIGELFQDRERHVAFGVWIDM
jgi:hypothetical protein